MSEADRINVILVPSGGEEAKVDAHDFSKQLVALLSALRITARDTIGERASQVKYKVEKLTTNSPANVGLLGETVEASDEIEIAEIHARFNEAIRFVEGLAASPRGLSGEWVKRMAAFCKPIGSSITEVDLKVGMTTHQLGIAFRQKLSKLKVKDFVERDSHLKGEMLAINIKAKKPSFVVFPRVGPEHVRCRFPESLIEQASKLVGRSVTVYGDLKYHWRATFPFEMKVADIKEMQSDSALPPASDLWGMAPNATRGKGIEEFVADLRDGD
jgi:hypothetical protein